MSEKCMTPSDGGTCKRPRVSIATILKVFQYEFRGLDIKLCVSGKFFQNEELWEVWDLNSYISYSCFPENVTYEGLVRHAQYAATVVNQRKERLRQREASKPACPVCPAALGGLCKRCKANEGATRYSDLVDDYVYSSMLRRAAAQALIETEGFSQSLGSAPQITRDKKLAAAGLDGAISGAALSMIGNILANASANTQDTILNLSEAFGRLHVKVR